MLYGAPVVQAFSYAGVVLLIRRYASTVGIAVIDPTSAIDSELR